MLESKELTKVFGSVRAVDHVSVRLEPGHVYALLGPNGSGKTTWMKMAAGLIKPTSGQMLYNDAPVGIESRREVAYMSTEPYFYTWMIIKDVGRYYDDFFEDFSMERYQSLLARMELREDMKTKTLSSGMMAKLKIAVTMARDAKVYMLDEPFNGIDLLARDEIRACILQFAAYNKILLLSSHLVEEMEAVADRALFIKQGQLVESVDLETMRMTMGVSMADRYRQIYGHTEVQNNA
ncbi:MAG: ABC transporter ATP-binding protein [Firmicutes bacterium]|nr:ABC transporter ATP-binding protein [Bacillota bacterium]